MILRIICSAISFIYFVCHHYLTCYSNICLSKDITHANLSNSILCTKLEHRFLDKSVVYHLNSYQIITLFKCKKNCYLFNKNYVFINNNK